MRKGAIESSPGGSVLTSLEGGNAGEEALVVVGRSKGHGDLKQRHAVRVFFMECAAGK